MILATEVSGTLKRKYNVSQALLLTENKGKGHATQFTNTHITVMVFIRVIVRSHQRDQQQNWRLAHVDHQLNKTNKHNNLKKAQKTVTLKGLGQKKKW